MQKHWCFIAQRMSSNASGAVHLVNHKIMAAHVYIITAVVVCSRSGG
jgi:hypothetical protein